MKKHLYFFSYIFFIQLFLLIISISTLFTVRSSHNFSSFPSYNITTNPNIPDTKSPEQNKIDKIFITLKDADKQTLNFGDKNTLYSASITSNSDNIRLSNETITIHGHGNSTWIYAKKPYTIKFSQKSDYFGLGKSKTYVLLASALDPTFMRTSVSDLIAKSLDINSLMNGKHVELYIDNEYSGLYYLTRKVNSTTADLKSNEDVLVEIENIHPKSSEDTFYTLPSGDTFVFADAIDDSKENQQEKLDKFIAVWQKAQLFIENRDYTSLSSILDIDSFAKYFLISEFSNNLDAYQTSFYFTYKNEKIYAGPVWDYDITYCSINSPPELCSPTGLLDLYGQDWNDDYRKYSTIIFDLLLFPEFRTRIVEIYNNSFKNLKNDILDYLETTYKYLYPFAVKDLTTIYSGPMEENPEFEPRDYYNEYSNLYNFISTRFDTFESIFSSDFSSQITEIIEAKNTQR